MEAASSLSYSAPWVCSSCGYQMTVDSVRRMETELSTELEKRRMGDNIVDSLEELLEQNKDLFHSSHHLITKTKLILSQSYGNTKGHMNKKQMARKIQVTF